MQAVQQMTIGELRQAIKRADPAATVVFDFAYFRPDGVDSYRGYYEQLAIGYSNEGEITVEQFDQMLRESLTKTFHGYKGGEYDMYESTPVWVANHGEGGGTAVVNVQDDRWRVRIITAYIDP